MQVTDFEKDSYLPLRRFGEADLSIFGTVRGGWSLKAGLARRSVAIRLACIEAYRDI